MPKGLIRRHGTGDLHFITISCHRHNHILRSDAACQNLQQILEETRQKYQFQLLGYVFMSNHIHLLLSEPETAPLSTAIQVIKQRFSRTRRDEFVWERRYHDFNVFTENKRVEKLRYMHRNPVKAGLVERPEDWQWSSFNAYKREPHPVQITIFDRERQPTLSR